MRLLLLFCLCCLPAPDSAAKEYRVYLLGGQSNMEGYGTVSELPPALDAPAGGVMIFHGNTAPDGYPEDGRGLWAPLRPGHGRGFASDGRENDYSDRFGAELTLARQLREQHPEVGIAVIKYARGGTSIDTTAAGQFGSWDPDFGGVNQYDHFLATLRNAFDVRDIDGDGEEDELVPAGIVWMQGESDAAHGPEVARRYRAHLERLMNLMRAALRVDDLPVVIGRISDSGQDDDGRVWNQGDIVRAAQEAYTRSDPCAALVTSTDGYGYSDKWHYDSDGYIDLGRRFAAAVTSLQGRRCGTGAEWRALFNGRDLEGWTVEALPEDGGETFWRVEDGAIIVNTMGAPDHGYVWLVSESEYDDFELHVRFQAFRDSPGNSGVQIRSRYDDSSDAPQGGWMDGPQVDIHPPTPWRTGLIYDETRETRRWISPSLEDWNIDDSYAPDTVEFVYSDEGDGWNDLHIIAVGNHITTRLNGNLVTSYDGAGVLDDAAHRAHDVGRKGHIALQLHANDELRLRFTEVRIRPLK